MKSSLRGLRGKAKAGRGSPVQNSELLMVHALDRHLPRYARSRDDGIMIENWPIVSYLYFTKTGDYHHE